MYVSNEQKNKKIIDIKLKKKLSALKMCLITFRRPPPLKSVPGFRIIYETWMTRLPCTDGVVFKDGRRVNDRRESCERPLKVSRVIKKHIYIYLYNNPLKNNRFSKKKRKFDGIFPICRGRFAEGPRTRVLRRLPPHRPTRRRPGRWLALRRPRSTTRSPFPPDQFPRDHRRANTFAVVRKNSIAAVHRSRTTTGPPLRRT